MAVTHKGEGPGIWTKKPLDKGCQGRECVSGLDDRALTQIVRGMGLSPSLHQSFPWYLDV